MTDIRIEREFAVTPDRLFKAITERAEVVQWWGPEGFQVTSDSLKLTKTGPWFAGMISPEGNKYKVSGQVTHVDSPRSIGFTWGWHDAETDERGAESHVTMTVVETALGARLIIEHRDLSDQDAAAGHESGWTSSLRSLAKFLN
ncbi:MAG: SRPBCC domain-containing protein [Pseudomonadota bacterium]